MTSTYARAYTEVLEILSYFSKSEYEKIPIEKIEFYKKYSDKDYKYKINPDIDLSEQEISREANAILITLFRDYFATEKQKEILKKILKQNQIEYEKEQRERHNPDNIFKNRIQAKTVEDKDEVYKLPIEVKETLLKKIINILKNIFHIC